MVSHLSQQWCVPSLWAFLVGLPSLLLFSSYCSDGALLPECLLESSCLRISFLCGENFTGYQQAVNWFLRSFVYIQIFILSPVSIFTQKTFLIRFKFQRDFTCFWFLNWWPFVVMTGQINLKIINLFVSFFGLFSYTGISNRISSGNTEWQLQYMFHLS